MKKKTRSKKTNGDYNKGQGIVIIIIILVLIKILTKCDFDEITNKRQSLEKRDEFIKEFIKKEINLEEKRKITEKEVDKIAPKYLCMQKDSTNIETAKWTLSINTISLGKPKSLFVGNPVQFLYVEHSCCPEKDKKFTIYDDGKLRWFDLIDQDLYFNILELSDSKVKHKNFSMELEVADYKKFNKLYKKAENSKRDHVGELMTTDIYFRDEEKFYYASNAFFREGMKDTNNFTARFDADCE